MADTRYAATKLVREKVTTLLRDIKVSNGYNTDVVTFESIWTNWTTLSNEKLPGLYVTNEADDLFLQKISNFNNGLNCPVDQDMGIMILGRVRSKIGERGEDLIEYLIDDTIRAVTKNPHLLPSMQLKTGHIRRPAPWSGLDKEFHFQLVLKYGATVNYARR